jgi:hypothetical protein
MSMRGESSSHILEQMIGNVKDNNIEDKEPKNKDNNKSVRSKASSH